MGKTPDSTSKLRQKLGKTEAFYTAKLNILKRKPVFTTAEKTKVAKDIAFCEAQLMECRAAQAELRKATRAQTKAGWGWSF